MRLGANYSFDERRREKAVSRRDDEARLARGEIRPAEMRDRNGFFSVLDRSKAKLLVRRARIKIDG
jgi:hypothetical protein